jgi:imidazole glycerol phosphate synthase subunit HisF
MFRSVGQLLVKDGLAAQSVGFSQYIYLGRLDIALESLASLEPDEISILDLDGNIRKTLSENYQAFSQVDLPLTVGGGGQLLAQHEFPVERVFYNSIFFDGTDKKVFSSSVPGKQSVVAYLPYRIREGELCVFNSSIGEFVRVDTQWLETVLQTAQEIAFLDADAQGLAGRFNQTILDTVSEYVVHRSYFSGGLSQDDIELLKSKNCAGYIIDNVSLYGNAKIYES